MSGEGRVVVVGAGPAGLTAGYLLAGRGLRPLVLEAGDQVGGLARTVVRDGYRFDLGGHRFFTKAEEVERLWEEVLGEELLVRPRLSRIHWNGRFLDYPLRAGDVLRKLGPVELARAIASYGLARVRPRRRPEETLEDWVCNRFGRRLFELFFRTYTEKVWGVPCSEVRAEWAAQRIKGLSLTSTARDAVRPSRENTVKSLIREFRYPRLGPGQMWEAMAREIERHGGEVALGAEVQRIGVVDGRVATVHAGGRAVTARHVLSSMPLRALAGTVSPPPPAAVLEAAGGLRYRDFLTVALALRGGDVFPDNWIYVHDPDVRVGRIQNFRSWSPWMVPREDRACLGLEYFCFEGDELWRASDGDLVELATRELERLGLARAADVERGWVVRVPKAYPVYDSEHARRLAALREWVDGVGGLQPIGRNGLHRYNNSDHSMLTAMRAVENLCERAAHDVWAVNADSAYHEERVPDESPYRRAPDTPAMSEGLA